MSSTIKQNVIKKTSKTRESSKERNKTKKDETQSVKTVTPRTNTKSKIGKPTSPTSRRVVKSQFFPSKQMYTDALKPADKAKTKTQVQKSNSRPTDKTTKLPNNSPKVPISTTKENKTANVDADVDAVSETSSATSTLERPRTATLRKGSIVNKNIAGPDVPKVKKATGQAKTKTVSPKSETIPPKVVNKSNTGNAQKIKSTVSPKIDAISLQKNKSVHTPKLLKHTDKFDSPKSDQSEDTHKTSAESTVETKAEKLLKDVDRNTSTDETLNQSHKIKAGIDVSLKSKTPEPPPGESYDDYEDDFDSYASDFDEYHSTTSVSSSDYSIETNEGVSSSSSGDDMKVVKPLQVMSSTSEEAEAKQLRANSAEEERKLDSGNFDLPEAKHKPILGDITEANGSLSDEGFEEVSLQFVNFLGAKRRRMKERDTIRRSKRGEELLGMIRLDQRNFTLIDIPPVSYDVYIKSFGNRNSTQVASQTRDDDVSEETQTEAIDRCNKWTQNPTKFSNSYREDYLGVGSDDPKKIQYELKYNEYNLANFLRGASQVIVTILQEHNRDSAHQEIQVADRRLPFSDGGIGLKTDFLRTRSVSCIDFSNGGNMRVLSVHPPRYDDGGGGDTDYDLKSIGCVWDLSDPSVPEDVFVGFGTVNAACFAAMNNKLIIGGLEDGTVTLWDLTERSNEGNYLEVDDVSKKQVPMTTSNFTTPPDLDHGANIVALHSSSETIGNSHVDDHDLVSSLQVLTLSENGYLTVWGLITKHDSPTGVGGKKHLVKNLTVSLGAANPELSDLHCTNMCVDASDPNHVYVTTNYGCTLHYLISGTKPNPKKYMPASVCKANSIEPCCHDARNYFLVGFDDGNVSLYSGSVEKPLRTINDKESQECTPVGMVQWSRNRPFIFYTSDCKSTVHIWDLSVSELFPVHSVSLKDGVKSIRLSDWSNQNKKRSYMAIIAKDESIYLHVLNQEHARQPIENYRSELKKFTNYVNRL